MDQEEFRNLVKAYIDIHGLKETAQRIHVHEKYLYRWLRRPELSGPKIAAFFGYWPIRSTTISYESTTHRQGIRHEHMA